MTSVVSTTITWSELMKKSITVSVLMATYNTDFALIKRAIDSVLSQYMTDFELIILDDGSTNDPDGQLRAYVRQHKNRITYLRHANCGQSKSIMRGIHASMGEYITILDADDEYKPEHLMACLRQMTDTDLIASTAETIVDTDADYFVPDRHDPAILVHVDDCILFATLFGRRAVFANIEFQDRYGADAYFYEHVARQYRVNKVDLRTYVYYRNVSTSICSVVKRQNAPVLAYR